MDSDPILKQIVSEFMSNKIVSDCKFEYADKHGDFVSRIITNYDNKLLEVLFNKVKLGFILTVYYDSIRVFIMEISYESIINSGLNSCLVDIKNNLFNCGFKIDNKINIQIDEIISAIPNEISIYSKSIPTQEKQIHFEKPVVLLNDVTKFIVIKSKNFSIDLALILEQDDINGSILKIKSPIKFISIISKLITNKNDLGKDISDGLVKMYTNLFDINKYKSEIKLDYITSVGKYYFRVINENNRFDQFDPLIGFFISDTKYAYVKPQMYNGVDCYGTNLIEKCNKKDRLYYMFHNIDNSDNKYSIQKTISSILDLDNIIPGKYINNM